MKDMEQMVESILSEKKMDVKSQEIYARALTDYIKAEIEDKQEIQMSRAGDKKLYLAIVSHIDKNEDVIIKKLMKFWKYFD